MLIPPFWLVKFIKVGLDKMGFSFYTFHIVRPEKRRFCNIFTVTPNCRQIIIAGFIENFKCARYTFLTKIKEKDEKISEESETEESTK